MDPTWGVLLAAALSALVSLGGIMYSRAQLRGQQELAERQLDNAELQALRAEFNAEKTARRDDRERDQLEIRYQAAVIRHLDDEVTALRRKMVEAGLSPPGRVPWPEHPREHR